MPRSRDHPVETRVDRAPTFPYADIRSLADIVQGPQNRRAKFVERNSDTSLAHRLGVTCVFKMEFAIGANVDWQKFRGHLTAGYLVRLP